MGWNRSDMRCTTILAWSEMSTVRLSDKRVHWHRCGLSGDRWGAGGFLQVLLNILLSAVIIEVFAFAAILILTRLTCVCKEYIRLGRLLNSQLLTMGTKDQILGVEADLYQIETLHRSRCVSAITCARQLMPYYWALYFLNLKVEVHY